MKAEKTFFSRVYEVVRMVPAGQVTTYGAIARYLGAGKSSRMVGWAMNNSHAQMPPVPAHRVVNRNGYLTGRLHFSYPERMQELLEFEGLEIRENRVVDFEKVFWDPAENALPYRT